MRKERNCWFQSVQMDVAQDSCQRCNVQAGFFRSLIGWGRARGLLFWFLVNFQRSDLNFSLAEVIFNILNLCDENIHRSGPQFGRIWIILTCDVLMADFESAATTWSWQIWQNISKEAMPRSYNKMDDTDPLAANESLVFTMRCFMC